MYTSQLSSTISSTLIGVSDANTLMSSPILVLACNQRRMSSLDLFDYKKHIAYLLPSLEPEQIFDRLVEAVLAHYNRPVSTLTELKKRELKTSVGTMWEHFCQDWLLAQRKGEEQVYDNVWTLQEWHIHCKDNANIPSGLVLGKKDIGIDLIAHSKDGYHAVQCKWKKKGKVTWAQLSTFIGLVGRSGPWVSHIVMTNGVGVLWKVKKLKKDKSLCHGTFAGTNRLEWTSITGGTCVGHVLGRTMEEVVEISKEKKEVEEENRMSETEKMRQARLARFSH